MTFSYPMAHARTKLDHVRIVSAINSLELFGHERGNIEALRALRDSGASILVGVSDLEHNHVAKYLASEGFPTFSLPFGPQWSKKWILKDPSLIARQPYKVVRCSHLFSENINRFSATHVHLGSHLTYSYIALALALRKVPVVFRMGDCPPLDSPFNMGIWRAAMRRSNRVVANSNFVRASAISAGVPSKRVVTIYNHPPRRCASKTEHAEVRFAGKSNVRLLYVGAISEEKGLIHLVEAFVQIAKEHPSLTLDIAGGSRWDGHFRGRLVERISLLGLTERIKLLGFVEDLSAIYGQGTLHVAPSIWEEPSGNTVVEAKQHGVPSVVFPSGGLPEHVRHMVDGFICRDKTVEGLVEGLRWMLADSERLRRMGEAARQDYETRFGLERFRRSWAKVYLDV